MSTMSHLAGPITPIAFPSGLPSRLTSSAHNGPRPAAAPTAVGEWWSGDAELAFVNSLERAMLAIVMTGASLFAAGLLRGASASPSAHAGAMVFGSVAIAGGTAAIWSTLTGLVRLYRLLSKSPAKTPASANLP